MACFLFARAQVADFEPSKEPLDDDGRSANLEEPPANTPHAHDGDDVLPDVFDGVLRLRLARQVVVLDRHQRELVALRSCHLDSLDSLLVLLQSPLFLKLLLFQIVQIGILFKVFVLLLLFFFLNNF